MSGVERPSMQHARQYSSVRGAIFNDERDVVAKKLLSQGASKAFVEETMNAERHRFCQPPVSLLQDNAQQNGNGVVPSVYQEVHSNFDERKTSHKKVTIVGAGQVGLAAAYSIINQGIASELCLIDHPSQAEKLEGEVKDLQQGVSYNRRVRIEGSTEYDISRDSNLVVITAGLARKPGETRLQLVEKNVDIMKCIITKVLEFSPNAPVCIVSNPCDIMSAVAAKMSRHVARPGQIFGSGTVLDSGRFRGLLAASLNVAPKSVHAYMIGEHGDSCVPVWSTVRVGGVPLLKPGESPSDVHKAVHKEVVTSGAEVIRKKGHTCWAIGMSIAHIAFVVLSDERRVMTVSTCARGFAGVKEDVFLSLPCVVGADGVTQILEMPLSEEERELFQKSAEATWAVQQGVWGDI